MENRQDNVLLLLESRTNALNKKIALGICSSYGWKELSYQGLGSLSRRLASYLMNLGVDKGDKVSILSESIPEWGAAVFASAIAGAITIPVDIKLTEMEMSSILNDGKPSVILVSKKFLDTALRLKEQVDTIEHIVVLNDSGANPEYSCLYSLPDTNEQPKWRHRGLNKTAFIIYTSGTTGKPKGVEITFKNVVSQVKSLGQIFELGEGDRFLSILPMNHLFELTVGFMNFLSKGASIYYSKSLKPNDVFHVMEEKQITFMVVVPAFLKLIRSSIMSEIKQRSKAYQKWFEIRYHFAKFLPSKHLKKLMFRGIHRKLGGKFKGFLSGGAPLDVSVAKFFERVGFVIYEGYGLSEASPVVSFNYKGATKLGSIGKAIPGVEVKIDKETGELLVRGDNVMKGYYNRPDLTADVLEPNGWLHTGDVAEIDKQGYLYITGRIKNMIVLDGGKKVFPEDLEAVYEKSPMFEEVCVFGAKLKGGQKGGTEDVFVGVYPSKEYREKYTDEKELEKEVKKEIKTLSQQVSGYKRPKNVIVAKEPFPRTATSKVKRKEVKQILLEQHG